MSISSVVVPALTNFPAACRTSAASAHVPRIALSSSEPGATMERLASGTLASSTLAKGGVSPVSA